jgi:hypothetical protein
VERHSVAELSINWRRATSEKSVGDDDVSRIKRDGYLDCEMNLLRFIIYYIISPNKTESYSSFFYISYTKRKTFSIYNYLQSSEACSFKIFIL